ncbi:MAG: RNA methyltransferase [Bacteroidetes bacterium 4572_77]|nr:MAG: RNA methyltransferase [Bacteroidetes bacterium 4572_77]
MQITKAEIKLINALKKSHGRKKHQAFLVEGLKMVEELLATPIEILLLVAIPEWESENKKYISLPFYRSIEERELQKLSSFTSSNQLIAVARLPKTKPFEVLDSDLILALDTIQDPGNLGTIIRTADWFGVKKIVCSKETADIFNMKVVQSSMGSVFRMHLYYTDLLPFLEEHSSSHTIYGSLLSGENMYSQTLKSSGIVVIGNESKGISPEVQKLISKGIYIPRASHSKAESLNAAIACSVILAEFCKSN